MRNTMHRLSSSLLVLLKEFWLKWWVMPALCCVQTSFTRRKAFISTHVRLWCVCGFLFIWRDSRFSCFTQWCRWWNSPDIHWLGRLSHACLDSKIHFSASKGFLRQYYVWCYGSRCCTTCLGYLTPWLVLDSWSHFRIMKILWPDLTSFVLILQPAQKSNFFGKEAVWIGQTSICRVIYTSMKWLAGESCQVHSLIEFHLLQAGLAHRETYGVMDKKYFYFFSCQLLRKESGKKGEILDASLSTLRQQDYHLLVDSS